MNGKATNAAKQESVHELEPIHGFPEALPQNENLIWQGSPDFWFIAKRVFYVKQIAFYFAFLHLFLIIFRYHSKISDFATQLIHLYCFV